MNELLRGPRSQAMGSEGREIRTGHPKLGPRYATGEGSVAIEVPHDASATPAGIAPNAEARDSIRSIVADDVREGK